MDDHKPSMSPSTVRVIPRWALEEAQELLVQVNLISEVEHTLWANPNCTRAEIRVNDVAVSPRFMYGDSIRSWLDGWLVGWKARQTKVDEHAAQIARKTAVITKTGHLWHVFIVSPRGLSRILDYALPAFSMAGAIQVAVDRGYTEFTIAPNPQGV